MNRRGFLKTLGAAGATATAGGIALAETPASSADPLGVLVDTTRCAGCRGCEEVCAEANGLPPPDLDNDAVFDHRREPTPSQWTVVNRFETSRGEVFAKKQCMHCVQPACATACLTKAMNKRPEGPVIWREGKCMGCRYCMVSCPFDVPKFEYDSPVPKIQKCQMCWNRVREGGQPSCVENCPGEALLFGRRSRLLMEARKRIVEAPDEYYPHVYGDREVGGTGYLYLSAVPFEEIGLRTDLGTSSYPELTKGFLYSVPLVLTLWPGMLLAVSNATRREDESGEGEE